MAAAIVVSLLNGAAFRFNNVWVVVSLRVCTKVVALVAATVLLITLRVELLKTASVVEFLNSEKAPRGILRANDPMMNPKMVKIVRNVMMDQCWILQRDNTEVWSYGPFIRNMSTLAIAPVVANCMSIYFEI